MTLYTGLDLDGLGLVLSLMVIIDSMGISHVAGPSWRSGPKMSPSGDSQTPGLDPPGMQAQNLGDPNRACLLEGQGDRSADRNI